MGHVQPKRKVCFITADGVIHKTKKEAKLHTNRIAHKLAQAKTDLYFFVKKQKEAKKRLAAHIKAWNHRQVHGWGTPQCYVSDAQRHVASLAGDIRRTEKRIAGLKRQLKGE